MVIQFGGLSVAVGFLCGEFAHKNGMSALTPKADMCGATVDVRFVPIADIGTSAVRALFNHVVSSGDYRGRHG